ncbi:MAG TPA: DUF6522 family protein [Paracoccaceae bacterium]|nr:DUF6522 family protein [Paracoccaceae bacterium]
MRLEANDDGMTINAADLARLLELPEADVKRMMRAGTITSRFERGEGEDAGRFRLTFFEGDRRIRLIVDGSGEVLQTSRSRIVPPT